MDRLEIGRLKVLVFGSSAIPESLSAEMNLAMLSESAVEHASNELGSGSGVGQWPAVTYTYGNPSIKTDSDLIILPSALVA